MFGSYVEGLDIINVHSQGVSLLATLISCMNFHPPLPNLEIYDILCMCIHEIWMAFNEKNRIVNKLHFMGEIKL
jgi:hypothetical protein